MALSDSCAEFIQAIEEAARKLSEDAHHYGAPDYPIKYGLEVETLKRAAMEVVECPVNAPAVGALVAVAAKVGVYLDAHPDDPELERKRAAVERVVNLLLLAHVGERANVESVVTTVVVSEGKYVSKAAAELKRLLSKLQKPAYDTTVKIISDVASATVKKMLGL
jgi:hypothetical protein